MDTIPADPAKLGKVLHLFRVRFHYVSHEGVVGKTPHDVEVYAETGDLATLIVEDNHGDIWIDSVKGPL